MSAQESSTAEEISEESTEEADKVDLSCGERSPLPTKTPEHLTAESLPRWLFWPLNSKFPLVSGPRKVRFSTTSLGQKVGDATFFEYLIILCAWPRKHCEFLNRSKGGGGGSSTH